MRSAESLRFKVLETRPRRLHKAGSSSISHRNRLPILPDHLQKLVSQFASSGASLSDIREVSLCLVAFSSFLRYDEISNIKCCDVDIKDKYFSLYIPKGKTDQYYEGCTRLVARTGRPTCPHSMLLRNANLAKENTTSREFVFRSLGFCKIKGHFLRPGTKLSYTRAREVILLKLKAIGLDTSKLGLHSFRIGGASAAINNDLPDRMVKKHGRRKTDKAKDLYCREDISRWSVLI